MSFLLAPLAAVFLWASSVSSRHHVVAADITAVTLYPPEPGWLRADITTPCLPDAI